MTSLLSCVPVSPPLVPAGGFTSTTEAVSLLPEVNGGGVDWDNEIYVRFNKSLYRQSSGGDDKSKKVLNANSLFRSLTHSFIRFITDDRFHGRKVDRYEPQNSIGQSKGFNKYPLGNFNVNSGKVWSESKPNFGTFYCFSVNTNDNFLFAGLRQADAYSVCSVMSLLLAVISTGSRFCHH